jgi:ABC-type uncharacterized transport system YnjBCD ATPase subunit
VSESNGVVHHDEEQAAERARLATMVAEEELADKRTGVLRMAAVVAAALTILVAVIGLTLNGQALRNTINDQGEQIEAGTVAVDRLTDFSAGQRSTIARLERRLDEAEAVAACRARIASRTDVALIRILRVVTNNALDRPPVPTEELVAIDEQLAAAQAERAATNQMCDTGESS